MLSEILYLARLINMNRPTLAHRSPRNPTQKAQSQ
jgi:hypothetical protein